MENPPQNDETPDFKRILIEIKRVQFFFGILIGMLIMLGLCLLSLVI